MFTLILQKAVIAGLLEKELLTTEEANACIAKFQLQASRQCDKHERSGVFADT